MKDLLEISCGLDVHKEKIVACILTDPLGKPTRSEIREFSTLIPDMIALRNWIVSKNCHHVAMESTPHARTLHTWDNPVYLYRQHRLCR